MMRSSFAGLTTARLAVMASQNAMEITGHNIANVKTDGYTRQRIMQDSLNFSSVNLYEKVPDAHIGYGVMVNGISQIRDPFLDIRYRMEMGNLGTVDQKAQILGELEGVLDDADREALQAQLSDLHGQLTTLSKEVTNTSYDNNVRSSAQTLVEFLNHYSKQLQEVKDSTVADTKSDVEAVNTLLQQIQELNINIKTSQTHGNPALELEDARNSLIDSLATYANISVTHLSEDLASGNKVDVLKVTMKAADGSQITLLDDAKPPAQFSFTEPTDPVHPSLSYQISITDTDGTNHADVKFDEGSFKSSLAMLNESGTFDTPPTSTNGIGYYQKMMDTFAATLAKTFNDLNTVGGVSHDLFAVNVVGADFTAATISISTGWLNGTTRIQANDGAAGTGAGNNENVMNMLAALSEKQTFSRNGATAYEGSFSDCIANVVNMLATDKKATDSSIDNYLSVAQNIADSRDSVSGVSLDEETMNMMMYNKSFSAASRLVTALDQMLDTIINGMGTVGR